MLVVDSLLLEVGAFIGFAVAMISLLAGWWIWFLHGLKILVAGAAAYFLVSIPVVIGQMLGDFDQWLFKLMGALLILFIVLVGVALFGFLFTRFYSASTWGHDAVRSYREKS